MKRIQFVFSCLVIIAFSGCDFSSKTITEGLVEYRVKFREMDNHMISAMMPSKMRMEFKDEHVRMELKAFTGSISTNFILDNQNLEMVQLFKAFKDKHYTKLDRHDVIKLVGSMPIPDIEKTDRWDTIAGYACQICIAKFEDPLMPDIELAFTQEIEIDRPNWFNMFSKVDGVLMKFNVYMFDMVMEMEAMNVVDKKISPDRFNIPDDYMEVTYPELNEKMDGLIKEYL